MTSRVISCSSSNKYPNYDRTRRTRCPMFGSSTKLRSLAFRLYAKYTTVTRGFTRPLKLGCFPRHSVPSQDTLVVNCASGSASLALPSFFCLLARWRGFEEWPAESCSSVLRTNPGHTHLTMKQDAEGKYFIAIGQAQATGEAEHVPTGTELANIAQCVEHLTTFTRMEQDKYIYRLGVLSPSIFGGNVRVSPTQLSCPDPRSLSATNLSSSNA